MRCILFRSRWMAGIGRRWLRSILPSQHLSCIELIEALEEEFVRERPVREVDQGKDRAILVSVTTGARGESEDSMAELVELARSAGVEVLAQVIQRRKHIHPRFILGRGKLVEIVLMSLRLGANLLLFDQGLESLADPFGHRPHRDAGHRPDPADPGYLCSSGEEPGRKTPGGDGPAEIYAARAFHP